MESELILTRDFDGGAFVLLNVDGCAPGGEFATVGDAVAWAAGNGYKVEPDYEVLNDWAEHWRVAGAA